jgi:uncharacterized protein
MVNRQKPDSVHQATERVGAFFRRQQRLRPWPYPRGFIMACWGWLLLAGLGLVACRPPAPATPAVAPAAVAPAAVAPPAVVGFSEAPALLLEATTVATATVLPTYTATATATATPTATALPTVTATPTITPTPTPVPHPLMIPHMREQAYPGSEIVIEQTLAPGINYNRYIASYQSEGLKIYALLTIPLGTKPETGWPVIIFNHGYIPPAQYRTTERYVAYVDAFARNGYIVFRSDYRGHGSSEGEARGGYGSPDYTIDVLNGMTAVSRHPDADPDRIGMWGHSMGGHVTLRAMVVSPAIKAGVIWAGVVASYEELFERWRRAIPANATPTPATTRRWRFTLMEMYGTPAENAAFWNSISPTSYVADLSGPVQIHHGTADSVVPLAYSASLHQRILDVNGITEFWQYEGDDHNLSANLALALQRSVRFFDQHVKNAGP